MIKENTSLLMRGLLIVLMGLGLSAQQISAQCALTTTSESFTNTTSVAISTTGTPFVTSTINVIGTSAAIVDLNVVTNITHTFSSDLTFTLTSPAGTSVTLSSDNGEDFNNVFAGTTWDDAQPSLVTDFPYVSNGVQSNLSPEEPLAAFFGEDPTGTWTLSIKDNAGGDGGALNSWGLNFTTAASIPAATTTSVASGAINLAIPDNNTTGVSSTLVIAGANQFFTGATVTINIPHTFPGNLVMTLTGPNSQVITLGSNNGGGPNNTYAGTTIDVDADPGNPAPYDALFGGLTASKMITDAEYIANTVETPVTPEQGFEKFFGLTRTATGP